MQSLNNQMSRLTTTSAIEKDKTSDHVYLNITLRNSSANFVDATNISATRTADFLTNVGSYNVTLARFVIASDTVPLVQQPLATTALTTPWFCGVSLGNAFSPTDHNEQPVLIVVDPVFNDRKCFSIDRFLELMNYAWQIATDNLRAAHPTDVPDGSPIMTFDPATGLYSLWTPTAWSSPTVVPPVPSVNVTMSFALYSRFFGFDTFVTNTSPSATNYGVTIRTYRTGNNLYPAAAAQLPVYTGTTGPTGDQAWLKMTQYAPWGSSLSQVTRLVITSSDLPLSVENISDSDSIVQQTNNNQTERILTDFAIGHDGQLQSTAEPFRYVSPFYRLTELNDVPSLKSWSFSVKIQRDDGTFEPLRLRPGSQISIKFLFLRKGLTV
jgi:hypothetical protein